MRLIKHLPNFLTLLNLFCGFIAIVLSFNINTLIYAPYFIFIAAGFDFADGLAARVLKAYSDIGKQLDSLADVVSFGVAPGILAFHLLQLSNSAQSSPLFLFVTVLIASFIPLFSAYRLAKFNVDERQQTIFYGLPTPASAIFISSLILLVLYYPALTISTVVLNFYFLSIIIILDAIVMVSEIPMFSLKFKNLRFFDNFIQYIFLIFSSLLIILFDFKALPLLVPLYVLVSLVLYIRKKYVSA
ncbi:MAG: CDP-alcohol phosphatidyltransferase family protein [Bacteroidales bacterium]|nr:CDP-alcohol phosphatidyltransferase family protein [Bacteroidales bacterium]